MDYQLLYMKKIVLLFFLLFSTSVFAEPITLEVAKQTAEQFLKNANNSVLKTHIEYYLTDAGDLFPSNNQLKSNNNSRSMFLFNIGDSAGFIIVSGDNAVQPILGYSNVGNIDITTIPPSVKSWLENYHNQILDAQKNTVFQNEDIAKMWAGTYPTLKASSSVEPLCKTKWDQSPFYNAMCPYDEEAGDYNEYHAVTGCPATAMAQIMKYWNWPEKGTGFHSYNHKKYGTLSANFGKTTYEWNAMPNEVYEQNDAIATLMYHCGVAVEMNYGPDASGSQVIKSIAYSDNRTVEHALPTYFGYDPNIEGKSRMFYSDKKWKALLKEELDNGRPVQYAGYGQGGHTFVCDGYDENDKFHMNWGWGGYCDGYYLLDNLVPGTGGTGSGSGTYNSNQEMLIGIQPAKTSSYNLILYNDVTISSSSIEYGDAFTVSVNIKNKGDNNFHGDYGAAIFDKNDKFIGMVATKEGRSLESGYHYSNNLEFTTNGMTTLYPGNYKIYICYRVSGGSWSIIGNSFWNNYDSYASLNVKPYSNNIRLFDNLNIVSEHIYSGETFEVNTDIANYGDDDFSGSVAILLATTDFNTAYLIDSLSIPSLPSRYHWGGDGLTFSTDSLEALPGTYLMMMVYFTYDKDGKLDIFDLVGATSTYSNPVEIIVQEKPLEPDKYENNNTIETAYTFETLLFNNNVSSVNTKGANIQNGSDIDYYAIELENGYYYTISGTLHDIFSEENSFYTGDMSVSYSFDGEIWSDSYDDTVKTFTKENGGIVYFIVTSYFAGGYGTYNLELTIEKSEPIQPDKYENNNTLPNAYVFDNLLFIDDEAIVSTSGANIHTSDDIDVYKIQLEEGYTYSFGAWVDDANYNIDSVEFYNADVLFTYSLDSENGSARIYDIMEDMVDVENNYVYFAVGMQKLGSLGSYCLNVVIRREKIYLPDKYEENDNVSSAYVFNNISFTNNKVTIHTDDANLHNETDTDVYAVALPAGYTYNIFAKLNDSYAEGNFLYTADAKFAYSIDGKSSSEWFDTNMESVIDVDGESIIYFAVRPYTTGSYDLEIQISREKISDASIAEIQSNEIVLYPNPCEDILTILSNKVWANFEIYNNNGTLVQKDNCYGTKEIDVKHLLPGNYTIILSDGISKISKQFIKL